MCRPVYLCEQRWYMTQHRTVLINFPLISWRSGAMGRCLDLRSVGRGFKSYSRQCCVTTWASCSHLCASVTKQYNLVPAKGRWCSAAGEVTAGLAESNGSVPPSGWLTVTCGMTACTPGSALGLTLGIEYGKLLPLPPLYLSDGYHCTAEPQYGTIISWNEKNTIHSHISDDASVLKFQPVLHFKPKKSLQHQMQYQI